MTSAVMPPIFTPELSQAFTPETHALGVPDVADQELVEYADGELDSPERAQQALEHARADKLWIQVAREYRILTGDKKADQAVWEEHQLAAQGAMDEEGNAVQDPLMENEPARDEYLKRWVEQHLGGNHAIRPGHRPIYF